MVSRPEGRLVPELDVPLHDRTAKVEIAVLEPQFLGGLGLVRDNERRDLGRIDQPELRGFDFDLPRGHLGIDGLCVPGLHGSPDADDVFRPGFPRFFQEFGAVRVEDDLGDSLAVPDVDEQEVPHVADPLNPAQQRDATPLVGGPKVAAVEGPFPVRCRPFGFIHDVIPFRGPNTVSRGP